MKLIRASGDDRVRQVLGDTLVLLLQHQQDDPNRWPTPIDIEFIVLTLKGVVEDKAVFDVLRGDLEKHDWFEGEDIETERVRRIEDTRDGPWGLRHSQAVDYVDSVPDPMIRKVLSFVLAKAVMLQVFEKKFPERKLDLFFLVESVGQALAGQVVQLPVGVDVVGKE